MRALSGAVALVLLAASAAAAPTREQLDATLKDLETNKQTAAELGQKLATNQRDLAAMQERSAALAERLQISERRVSRQESALADTNAQLAAKQKEFDARKEEYARTIVNLLRLRELPPTALFTNPDDIHQLMRSASVLQNTNQAIAVQAARLKADMVQLRGLRTEAGSRQNSTRAEQVELQASQAKLDQEVRMRQQAQARLSADRSTAEEKVADLSRQSASLQDLIGKLEVERQKRPEPAKPLRQATATYGELRAPVVGELAHGFGEKKSANESYRGLVIRTRPGASVVSPADGEVVFTGPFRDYGRMVLIKHKGGLITLIAGLGDIRVNLNQAVLRGEPLGTMPSTGAPEAYIELRDKEAKPIDPAHGFANLGGKSA